MKWEAMEWMIQSQIVARGVRDERVLDAMRKVPRGLFMLPEYMQEAYADGAFPIGLGQTISQPYIVALMTEALDARPTDRVLEIGTGSGYQTAILAHLAAEVYTVERLSQLQVAAHGRLKVLGLTNVWYRVGDGTTGWPEHAPFERILITAAGPDLPRKLLLSQLADGGKAVLPAGPDECQDLLVVTRHGEDLIPTNLGACRFVRLVGAEGWIAAV